ncbi:MAG: hypothetical protein AAB263_12325, partial [Planctomycetota bacterium]
MLRHLLTLLVLSSWLLGTEPKPLPLPPHQSGGEIVPAPPSDDPSIADLRSMLKDLKLTERDGKLWWQGENVSIAVSVIGIDARRDPIADTVAGTVTIQRTLIERKRSDALVALLNLAPIAKQEKITGLRLTEGPLTGLHLRNSEFVVLGDGILHKQEIVPPNHATEIQALKTSIARLKVELPSVDMDESARRSLSSLIDKLPSTDQITSADDASPHFMRRLVRSGWLQQFFPTLDIDKQIEDEVRTAEQPCTVRQWSGSGGHLAEVRNAFGEGGYILRTPSRSAWMVDHPMPTYYKGSTPLKTVVELAQGSDPLVANAVDKCLSARLWWQTDGESWPIARWTVGGALECTEGDWMKAVPRRSHAPHLEAWLPPHLLVNNLQGDFLALITSNGALLPPRDSTKAEGERFLADAARVMPDAASLDLIGEYLFRYVFDSPDPRRPTLIGTKSDKGDIHQTALQTLANVSSGMFRGDCDDLAELYETIADRQGRTAHVVSLPGHAACCWAEKRPDGWQVFILQTGPPLQFTDSDPQQSLQKSLVKVYNYFDASSQVDPNGLSLLLRFNNENQRGNWRLSYRVFEEPEYARVMIDVQKDWHFSTYQRGITKMERLINSSEQELRETANFRELSGLYSYTGQYAEAAKMHQLAIDKGKSDLRSTLFMNIELVGHLFDAGKVHQAREVALDLI